MKTKRKASDKMSKHLLNMASRHGQPQYHPAATGRYSTWLDAQDEHERQLRLLSQRHDYKGRLPRIISKLFSINSKLTTPAATLNGIGGLCTDIATGDEEESWLATRQQEAQSWQQRRTN